jgi:predicted phage terminase large subunit-like protein
MAPGVQDTVPRQDAARGDQIVDNRGIDRTGGGTRNIGQWTHLKFGLGDPQRGGRPPVTELGSMLVYPALKANVPDLAKRFGARRVLVEDTGAGTSLVQELRSQVAGIIAVKPEGDKASRMAVASAKFEAGQVLLPERATWLPDLEAELFAFPGSRHYDQCDSISQALLDKINSFMTWLSPDDWARIIVIKGYSIGIGRAKPMPCGVDVCHNFRNSKPRKNPKPSIRWDDRHEREISHAAACTV